MGTLMFDAIRVLEKEVLRIWVDENGSNKTPIVFIGDGNNPIDFNKTDQFLEVNTNIERYARSSVGDISNCLEGMFILGLFVAIGTGKVDIRKKADILYDAFNNKQITSDNDEKLTVYLEGVSSCDENIERGSSEEQEQVELTHYGKRLTFPFKAFQYL